MPDLSSRSVDIAISALDSKARAGWAKAFALEQQLAEANATLREIRKLSAFKSGVIYQLAPSLSPWLNNDVIEDFQGIEFTSSDDVAQCRLAGRAAADWRQSKDRDEQRRLDWRAREILRWYHDPDAKLPVCACGRETWDHSGPDEPCLQQPRPSR